VINGGGLAIDPTGRLLYMGQVNGNSITAYMVNGTTGALTAVTGSPFPTGADPEHLVVDPGGKFLYVSNRNDPQGGISVYTINASGALAQVAGSPFPTQASAGPAGLAVHPNGKFLYVGLIGTSNPNHFIAAFSVNSTSGALTALAGSPISTGQDPRYVALDPSGQFLYTSNSGDNTISAFSVDANSGVLTEIIGSPFSITPFVDGIVIDAAGKFLYAAGPTPITPVSTVLAEITTFRINTATGALSPVTTIQTGSSDGTNLVAIVQSK
jgi:6-phosphogluconolactonase